MINARGIKKSYGQIEVLKGVDLDIYEGEIVSIIGKSGTGKSTLLHILGTLDTPDEGDVLIDGQDVNKLSRKALAKLRNEKIGFVFQFHHLLKEFTAIENIIIPALIKGMPKADAYKKALGLLEYLNLSDRVSHKPSQMSGGEQQRIAIARALINDPVVIFADEPTGNLDSATSSDLHQLFLRLRDDFKQTFVIVTHNNELSSLSNRTLRMADGLIVASGA